MGRPLTSLPRLTWNELADFTFTGPRARLGLAAALAVGGAIGLALLLRMQTVFWAGISAFVCMQASHPQSLRKGLHRIWGTFLAAVLSLILVPLVIYNPAATLMLLFLTGTISLLGCMVGTYSYAWLLGGITMLIIILLSLDNPGQLYSIAVNRCLEISLGTAISLAAAKLLLPTEGAATPPAPGWRSLLHERSYMIGHAARTGFAVALVPVIWRIFELPDLTQMAISISAVMAVPALTGHADEDRLIVIDRALQRIIGCILGAGTGLLFLLTPLAGSFAAWLGLLMAGAAIGVQMETGRYAIPAVGIQAAIGLIVTLVQGWGPAVSLTPAFERFGGMLCAISLLLIVNFFFAPSHDRAQA